MRLPQLEIGSSSASKRKGVLDLLTVFIVLEPASHAFLKKGIQKSTLDLENEKLNTDRSQTSVHPIIQGAG